MDARAIEKLIYSQSGLLGVSGVSSDMRTLLESTEPRAQLAVDLFVYRIGRELGSLAAALGGLDAIVFTAGIGENAAPIRERVCRQAAWLGVELDAAANAKHGPRISTAASRTAAWVIPTNEELMIARHTRDAAREGLTAMEPIPTPVLAAKKALVVGIANEYSIAYGCANAFRSLGAELAITYLNDKARPHVEPLAKELGASIFLPLDVQRAGELEAVFDAIRKRVGAPRHPGALDRVRAEGGSAGRPPRLLGRGLQGGDGRVLPFLHPHGAARRAADDRRRHDVRNELPRRAEGGAELQRDGAGEGGARSSAAAISPTSSGRRASASTRSRPGRSRRAPRPG